MTTRKSFLPIDHIVAELAAIPLASRKALELSLLELCPNLSGTTSDLWRYTEANLLRALPAIAVDELVHYRDRVWFSHRPREAERRAAVYSRVRLVKYLEAIAMDTLEVRGRSATPSELPYGDQVIPGTGALHGRLAWRWLNFALPPDLLLAAHPEEPESVETITPNMARWLLEKGYSEAHAHLGASMDFTLFWALVMVNIGYVRHDAFKSPGAQLNDGEEIGPWILRAAIVRLILAQAMFGSTPSGGDAWSHFESAPELRRFLVRGGPAVVGRIEQVVSDLEHGWLSARAASVNRKRSPAADFEVLKALYRAFGEVRSIGEARTRAEALMADPICKFLSESEKEGPDLLFLRVGLNHVRQQRGFGGWLNPKRFERLFWQVVRAQGLMYRHVVQRPLTPGLQWFVRHYDRMAVGKRGVSVACMVDSALLLAGEGRGLRSLEARTAPEATVAENAAMIDEVADAAEGREAEVGLVLHFIRSRGRDWGRGEPKAHGRGGMSEVLRGGGMTTTRAWRFGGVRRKLWTAARAVVGAVRAKPNRLRTLRGIDICTDEYGVPLWVVSPVFRWLRDETSRIASETTVGRGQQSLVAPSATVHAGEDFIHLLGGIRRIHESIYYLNLREGDRIGHALAMGIDAERWAHEVGRVLMTNEERMFDLAWELDRGIREGQNLSAERHHYIKSEITRLGRWLFEPDTDVYDILRLARNLHDERKMRELGYAVVPPMKLERRDSEEARLLEYLSDDEVFRRSQELVYVDVSREAAALADLQESLRRECQRRGLIIEVNPTSNLLVGNLADVDRHPLWQIAPVSGIGGVNVMIGSDDPITVATDLRREYQMLMDTMVLTGAEQNEAWRWLDGVRSTSLRGRFTLMAKSREDERDDSGR